MRLLRRTAGGLITLLLGSGVAWAEASSDVAAPSRRGGAITLIVRDTPVAEIFEMISRKERVSIVVGAGITGNVSVNLYDVSLDRAIRLIARSAGYVATRRSGAWQIMVPKDAGVESAHQHTIVRALKIQYTDPQAASEILANHLSLYGQITPLVKRRLLIVEDLPESVARLEALLAQIDQPPRQILLEARILEISLTEEDAFGIDWTKFFAADDGSGVFGMDGLVIPGNSGFFFELLNSDIAVILNALRERRQVRTLATPSLLALENQEAEVVIGDRLGFRVTTTINQVTSESVEFLESGVILKFTAAVDRDNRILLAVHPEVSTGVLTDGLPSQTTTEVSTTLLIEDGQQVFIGGLINDRYTDRETGVPFISDIPYLGRLFRGSESINVRTETVVLLTAHVWPPRDGELVEERTRWVPEAERVLDERARHLEKAFEGLGERPPWALPASGTEAGAVEPESVPVEGSVDPNQ